MVNNSGLNIKISECTLQEALNDFRSGKRLSFPLAPVLKETKQVPKIGDRFPGVIVDSNTPVTFEVIEVDLFQVRLKLSSVNGIEER